MRKAILLSLFVFLLLALQCQRKEVIPPASQVEETQTGENSFSCTCNGHFWEPAGSLFTRYFDRRYSAGNLYIYAKRTIGNKVSQTITMQYANVYKPGTYFFKGTSSNGSSQASFVDNVKECIYESTDNNSARTSMTITRLDTAAHIISGRFSLFFPAAGKCDSLSITNGLFDFKF